MGLKARLSSYCTKRANNGVNLVTSRKINTRLARPIKENKSSNKRGFSFPRRVRLVKADRIAARCFRNRLCKGTFQNNRNK